MGVDGGKLETAFCVGVHCYSGRLSRFAGPTVGPNDESGTGDFVTAVLMLNMEADMIRARLQRMDDGPAFDRHTQIVEPVLQEMANDAGIEGSRFGIWAVVTMKLQTTERRPKQMEGHGVQEISPCIDGFSQINAFEKLLSADMEDRGVGW